MNDTTLEQATPELRWLEVGDDMNGVPVRKLQQRWRILVFANGAGVATEQRFEWRDVPVSKQP